MKRAGFLIYIGIGFGIVCVILSLTTIRTVAATIIVNGACDRLGWFPSSFGLKDHTVFWYDGYYYIMSIYLPGERQFAYGRSPDLCAWEVLAPVLTERTPGGWDELSIWAPFVFEEGGLYYAFYTGVKGYPNMTQSILLAISSNPADPAAWQPQGMVFQPDHAGMIWENGHWADCRDPMVFKQGSTYYLYYTGFDVNGGIVGLATASSLRGPWVDQGAVVQILPPRMPESPTLIEAYDSFYLIYHDTASGPAYQGERFRVSESPSGPFGDAQAIFPGWAHEFWPGPGGELYVSYLTDYTITMSPLRWDMLVQPPRPWIDGYPLWHMFVPVVGG
jgi:predicted GH43/DUF377 family glycosyl hydrolase